MVIWEFTCDDIRRIGPELCVVKEDIESAIAGSCLTVPQVKDYAGWKSGMSYADLKDLYGWHISQTSRFTISQEILTSFHDLAFLEWADQIVFAEIGVVKTMNRLITT